MADVKPIANDPVAGLIDIPMPREVGMWPQTWPARIAIAVLLAVAVIALWRFMRRRHVDRYRREALVKLKRIEGANAAPGEVAAQLSLLVRRTALAAFPREQVAALAGPAWLAFLDRTSDATEFSRGVGQWLASAPYACAELDESQNSALVALVRRWIRGHHA